MSPLERFARLGLRLLDPLSRPIRALGGYFRFLRELRAYRRLPGAETVGPLELYPCLWDRETRTSVDPTYFYQDTWAARRVFAARPALHVDIGSTALLVGVLAQFTRVLSLDIRPLDAKIPGLTACRGSGLALPLADRSIGSLTSLCVLEHIGLGRYGDPLDPAGTDRAAAEIQRVLAPGGDVYVSVPIEERDRVYFNAHRTFSVESFRAKFPELTLAELAFVQNHATCAPGTPLEFGGRMVVGLFHFQRPGS